MKPTSTDASHENPMPDFISERSAQALLALFPNALGRPDAASWLVDQLVDAELNRRGNLDAAGAFHALALTQGALLKDEFDFSTQAHSDGWVLGAVLVNPLEFTLFNMKHGFPAGDVAIRAMVSAMKETAPGGKVVRIHLGTFAVLLGPTASVTATPELLAKTREALTRAVPEVKFTMGLMELTVVEPTNAQLLGPLVWAECERALVIARRQPTEALQVRRVEMNGRLPDFNRR